MKGSEILETYCIPFKNVFRFVPLWRMTTYERIWLELYDDDNMRKRDRDNGDYLGWNISYFDGRIHRLRWLGLVGEVYFRVDEKCEKYQMFYSQEQLSGDTGNSYYYDKEHTDGYGYYYDHDDTFADILDGFNYLKWRDLDDNKVLLSSNGELLIPSTDGKDIYMVLMFLPESDAVLRDLIDYQKAFFRVAMFNDGKLINIRNISKEDEHLVKKFFYSNDYLEAYIDLKRKRYHYL